MWPNAKVSVMGSQQLSNVMASVSKCVFLSLSLAPSDQLQHHFFLDLNRDPAHHEALASQIENESTPYYASARLWDDGIIRPTDTRDVLGLALSLHRHSAKGTASGGEAGVSTTWDGEGRGFGVFRM